MTNTKKILAIALAVILIASVFTACGNKDKPVAAETTSNTVAEETTETTTEVTVPPIEGDETQADEKSTNSAKKDDKGSTKKQTTTTKKATASGVKKPSSTKKPTTTKKPAKKPTTTKKPSDNKPTSNQFKTFKASTGENIRYCSYHVEYGKATISESGGKITVTYANGVTDAMWKCSNCGKYLCEGCQPVVSDKCPYCGKTNCHQYGRDINCPYCGEPVKAYTCHSCSKSPSRT